MKCFNCIRYAILTPDDYAVDRIEELVRRFLKQSGNGHEQQ
ncbi:hypothetical protein [Nostoc sp. FACHB-280]|nr:hypothetical protein [Nostoc sp. FACHB-280]